LSTSGTAEPTECVIEIDPRRDDRWDRYVRSHPNATVYHLSAWAEILHRAYGYRPHYLALTSATRGELEGVLPLIRSRGILSGSRLRSLPVVNSGGPLAADAASTKALLEAACDRAERGIKLLMVRTRQPGLHELMPRLESKWANPVWVTPLPEPGGADLAAWKKHSRNLYRSVNKALAAGLSFREAEGEQDLRRWYTLYLATMRKRAVLPRTWRQLETTRRLLEVAGEFRLFVVEQDGRMVAGVVTHPFGDTVELVYNGSDPASLELRPNHLLNWGVLQWASERGYRFLDFGEAQEGGPLANFKAQFKAAPVTDYRYDYVVGVAPGRRRQGVVREEAKQAEDPGRFARPWAQFPLRGTHAAAAFAYRFL
jgi:CelD/BcsL family acetyltransferase involved in cellulose biosynthesis